MTRKDKHSLIPIAVVCVLVWLVALLTDEDPVEDAPEVVERVVEKEVVREALKIEAVEYVCHAGKRHFAVYYEKTGQKHPTWFIAATPHPKNCTGDEKVHPEDRDKIRKEDEAKRKAAEKS